MAILSFQREGNEGELLGVWKVEYEQAGGSEKRRGRELWVFRPGRLAIVGEDHHFEFRTTVDASADPKQIDTDNMFRARGIYEIKGDSLRVIFGMQVMPRPIAFAIEAGDLQSLAVLQRIDANSRDPLSALRERLAAEVKPRKEYGEPLKFDRAAYEAMRHIQDGLPDRTLDPADPNEIAWRIFWLETEVNNGGMHQFFWNSAGDFARQTVDDLRLIGAPKTAAIVDTGCQLFPAGVPPSDTGDRRAQIEAFSLEQMDVLQDLS